MKAKLKTYLDAKFASLADQIDYSLRHARRKDPAPRFAPTLPAELPEPESLPEAAQFAAWSKSVDNWLLALTDRVLAVEDQLTDLGTSIADLRDSVATLKLRLDLNEQKLRALDAHMQALQKRAEIADSPVVRPSEPALLARAERGS
jgi:hypothetical protein